MVGDYEEERGCGGVYSAIVERKSLGAMCSNKENIPSNLVPVISTLSSAAPNATNWASTLFKRRSGTRSCYQKPMTLLARWRKSKRMSWRDQWDDEATREKKQFNARPVSELLSMVRKG